MNDRFVGVDPTLVAVYENTAARLYGLFRIVKVNVEIEARLGRGSAKGATTHSQKEEAGDQNHLK